MQKTELTQEQYDDLTARIFPILAKKGPAQTTMDLLARKLSISKRTLYEIFESKDEMIRRVLANRHKFYENDVKEIILKSENVMEALAMILLFHQKAMSTLSAEFFRDMDERYHHLRSDFDCNKQRWIDNITEAIMLGVEQGVFRKDANYRVVIPLINVQMESLKRMEEFFPSGITLIEAYNAIAIGFLRSIATEKGMATIEKLSSKFQ